MRLPKLAGAPFAGLALCAIGVGALAACSQTATPQGTGGGGGHGGNKAVSCTWTATKSDATCAKGSCSLALDEEMRCDDTWVAMLGLRVAPAPDATWLATTSMNDRLIYRVTSAGAEREEGVPGSFRRTALALALAPDGAVHLAADTTTQTSYNGGLEHALYAKGAWTTSTVFDRSDKYTPLIDLETAPDGSPRVWLVSDAPNTVSLATEDAKGAWSLSKADLPAGGSFERFTLTSEGKVAAFAFDETQTHEWNLHVLVDGKDQPLGLVPGSLPSVRVAPAPAPAAPSNAHWVAAFASSSSVTVLADVTGKGVVSQSVPGTTAIAHTCSAPPYPACDAPCHETGKGLEEDAWALAWTDDGVAWVVHVETKLDEDMTYAPQNDDHFCIANVAIDRSTGVLHLVRVPLDGTPATEVMSLPIARPAGADLVRGAPESMRFVDARGFGKDLAIGVRTGWHDDTLAVRLLRVDTSKL